MLLYNGVMVYLSFFGGQNIMKASVLTVNNDLANMMMVMVSLLQIPSLAGLLFVDVRDAATLVTFFLGWYVFGAS